MKRGFPGKSDGEPAAKAALKALLTQARTLEFLTAASLARSYNVPLETVERMLREAKLERFRREAAE